MAFQKAQDLAVALPLLNHLRDDAIVEDLNHVYVDRPEVHQQLDRMVDALENDYPGKFLLTGHKGVGKSISLARLAYILQQRGRLKVVHLSLKNKLNLQDIEYSDIIFVMALEILRQCQDWGIDLKPDVANLITDWGKSIELVREEAASEEATLSGSAEVGVSAGTPWFRVLSIKALMGIGTKFAQVATTRKTIRQTIEKDFDQLLEVIDNLQQAIQDQTGQRLVCLVDGTDRTSIKKSEDIFLNNGKSMSTDLPCAVVYTFPVALQYSEKWQEIKPYFNDAFPVANFKVKARDWVSDPDEEQRKNLGLEQLRQVITNRVEKSLFEPQALDTLVAYSGGVPRMVFQLAYAACSIARGQGMSRIEQTDVQRAIAGERNAFQKALTFVSKDFLRLIQKHHQLDQALDELSLEERKEAKKQIPDLLHNLSVVEYVNGEVWYDVHPIVQDLL
jgi:hypothetical protein